MYNKIFISYATEDLAFASKLYDFLQQNNFSPWMDKKNLLPGQNWDFYIQQELRKADFIILLLSGNSVAKRGYVQKEFRQAVAYCEEKLDSDIYIIPVKLDACVVPASLSKFQWVEFSSDDSMNRIIEAINHQRTKILKEEQDRKARLSGFDIVEKTIVGELGEKSPKSLYEIVQRTFKDETNESLNELNIIIQKGAIDRLMGLREGYYKYLKDINAEDEFFTSDSTHYEGNTFHFLAKKFVSYTSFISFYSTGAAHGQYGTSGHNYFLNPLMRFHLEEMFENYDESLKILRDIVDEKLMEKARKEFDAKTKSDFYLLDEELKAVKENFDNYYFKENALVFIYNPYHLTAWALGDHHPEITFNELRDIFPKERKLLEFLDSLS